jgi:hypothetical protein
MRRIGMEFTTNRTLRWTRSWAIADKINLHFKIFFNLVSLTWGWLLIVFNIKYICTRSTIWKGRTWCKKRPKWTIENGFFWTT